MWLMSEAPSNAADGLLLGVSAFSRDVFRAAEGLVVEPVRRPRTTAACAASRRAPSRVSSRRRAASPPACHRRDQPDGAGHGLEHRRRHRRGAQDGRRADGVRLSVLECTLGIVRTYRSSSKT